MSITITPITGTPYGEYAATNIQFPRSEVQNAQGFYEAQFTGRIDYQRTDYLVDTNGNKLSIIQHLPQMPVPSATPVSNQQDPYYGTIILSATQMAPYLTVVSTEAAFAYIASTVDTLIQADLVARGIMTAPVATPAS